MAGGRGCARKKGRFLGGSKLRTLFWLVERRKNPYSLVRQTNSRAQRRYVPRPYPDPVTLFLASESPVESTDPRLGWRKLAGGGLNVIEVSGNHLSMMTEPHVMVLAQRLKECLDATQGSGGF